MVDTTAQPAKENARDSGISCATQLRAALEQPSAGAALPLGEWLLAQGLISDDQLAAALQAQRGQRDRRLGNILIDSGALSGDTVTRALVQRLGIPYVDVDSFVVEPDALAAVPRREAMRHQVLPLMRYDEDLVVAVSNPLLVEPLRELQFVSGLRVVPVLADANALMRRLMHEYAHWGAAPAEHSDSAPTWTDAAGADTDQASELASELEREHERPAGTRWRSAEEQRVARNALVRLVNTMIADAHQQAASDIHIECSPGRRGTLIRFRRDGELSDYLQVQGYVGKEIVSRIKVMAGLNIAEHRIAQDGKIDFGRYGALPLELRVAVVPTAGGHEDVVLRLLGGMAPMPLSSLGLDDRLIEELRRLSAHSYGMLLSVGPTGSGKTTTLHALLQQIKSPGLKIWTAEDPIEITQPGLRQVQVHPQIGWSFSAAMRAFLRADPDVIMIGEMRDAETAKIAIEASLTGHLVLSTLHTNSAAESVTRLLELGMDPFNFADALLGILSQRLARRLCRKCARPRVLGTAELEALLDEYCLGTHTDRDAVRARWLATYPAGVSVREPCGCRACSDGYSGRIGVFELLVANSEVRQAIRARQALPQILDAALSQGMRPLHQDAIDKLLNGDIDLATARAVCS
jgi:type II secretory ATPase GspE/PulE/Tfp pilus assembly ATPase PilB-like protein